MNIQHHRTLLGPGVSSIGVNAPMTWTLPTPIVPVLQISDELREHYRNGETDALVYMKDFSKGDSIQIATDDGKRFVIGYWNREIMVQEIDENDT